MKIADVAEFYSEHGGGVRSYVHQKLKASARLGHETVIIAPGPVDREDYVEGGKIVWVKAPRLALDPRYHIFTSGAGVRAALERERPDIVEGSSPWRGGWIAGTWNGDAAKVLVMHADPVAVYPHTLLDRFVSRPRIDSLFGWFWRYLRRLNGHFDATVVAGDWLATRFSKLGLARLEVVPFGVEHHLFRSSAYDSAVRREMLTACGLDEAGRLLLAVGRHHPEKRLTTLMDAVTLANKTQPVGLFLIGDGPIRTLIERAARKNPHVHIAGQVKDRARVATMMASADGLLHGSGSETFGLAVAEALSAGCPIIVPNAGGAADFADDSYAQVYRLGDATDAAAAITRLLARDRKQLSSAALRAAAKIGDADSHFERLFDLYGRLLLARRNRAS
jgi:alpha-1,6-mannosyltransferase